MDFSTINDLQAPTSLTKPQVARQRALKVARQFEELFARQMVQQMQKGSMTGDEGGFFGNGIGSSTYSSWFEQQLASKLSSGRGLGIGDSVMRYLERTVADIGTAEEVDAEKKPATSNIQRERIDVAI